jgi:hypothetical protein
MNSNELKVSLSNRFESYYTIYFIPIEMTSIPKELLSSFGRVLT